MASAQASTTPPYLCSSARVRVYSRSHMAHSILRPSTLFSNTTSLPQTLRHKSQGLKNFLRAHSYPHSIKNAFKCRALGEETRVVSEMKGVSKSEDQEQKEYLMLSVAPVSLVMLAALPGGEVVRSAFLPIVEVVKSLDLPQWLVHWGHPGNMGVVLFAMGGYGSYLGWQIRLSDDAEVKAKAKDLHPKLLAGMFFFFVLGATGGVISLLTTDKPILESPHAVTGLIGLSLLTIQSIMPALFEGSSGLRTVHGFLGSGIMALFLIHSVLGLQLGLSF